MKSYQYKIGVTLIEIVIVIAIIALLVSMVIGISSHIDDKAKENGLNNIFAQLESAIEEYHQYSGKFPEQIEKNFANAPSHSEYLYKELQSIPDSRKILEKISNTLLKNKFGASDSAQEIYDPWGTAFDYRYITGDNFPELISAGPDKKFDTNDDISSKKE